MNNRHLIAPRRQSVDARDRHRSLTGAAAIGSAAGTVIASVPGVLPRTASIAGWTTAALVGTGAIIGILVAWLDQTDGVTGGRRLHEKMSTRRWVASAIAVLWLGVVVQMLWQNGIRADLGVSGVGFTWFSVAVAPATVVVLVSIAIPRICAMAVTLIVAVIAGHASAGAAGAAPQETLDVRARMVVEDWWRSGGACDDAVVIAVPTGSGWVDDAVSRGLRSAGEHRVAVLTLPYATSSSWRVFVSQPDRARVAGRTLVSRVIDRVTETSSTPDTPHCRAGHRPRILLYGQSLGAIGADAARAWAARAHPGAVSGTVLSGVPGRSIDGDHQPDRVVLTNRSDPVADWSWSLAWRPPRPVSETRIEGREVRRFPWLPVASFVQTSIDLLAALDAPSGVGHRYGNEQGQALAGFIRPTPDRPTTAPHGDAGSGR